MSQFGVDEDWQRLSPAQLLAGGRTFAIGYVSEDTTGKNITAAEVHAYLAAGVAVLLVYEYSTTAIAGGYARGVRDAGIAVAHARALGYPASCAIAFAVDQDTSSNPSAVDGYCRGFTATVHANGWRSMVYGGYSTVRYALDHGIVDLGWQTYAWSGNPTAWDPRAAIRQVQNAVMIAGKQVDLDTAMVDDFGAWTGVAMSDADIPDTHRLASNGDTWARAVVKGEDPASYLGYGATAPNWSTTPNVLHQKLDAILSAAQSAAGAVTQPVAVTQDQVNTAVLQALANPTVVQTIAAAVASHIHVT